MTDRLMYHNEAMLLAEKAQLLRIRGEEQEAMGLFRQALELERRAAELTGVDDEPTRSVLYRSAGSLAMDCGMSSVAERLFAAGLAGNPPSIIAEEIRDLMEDVVFTRHLDLRGIHLEPSELQMSLAGNAIGYGMARTDDFLGRVRDLEKVVQRTAERRLGRPYRERGRPLKEVAEAFEIFLSVPRAASFAVSVRIGRREPRLPLGAEPEAEVLDEILDLFELAETEPEALSRRIPDPAYLRNFVALAKNIAPDGERVSLVGFTAIRGNETRMVSLRKPGSFIHLPTPVQELEEHQGEEVIVQGVLHYADDVGAGDGTIKLETERGKHTSIRVPEGLMADIVRPLWDHEVQVVGMQIGKEIVLKDIRLV